jgi:hypothetical protein
MRRDYMSRSSGYVFKVGVLALAVLALTACGDKKKSSDSSRSTSTTSTTAAAKSLVLEAKDDGSKQTINVGDTVTINLGTAGGSGYTWKVTKQPDPAVLEVVSTTQTTTSPAPATSAGDAPMVGRPETVTTVLRGKAPGTTSLVLSHVPPGGGAAEDTFTVELTVKAAQ